MGVSPEFLGSDPGKDATSARQLCPLRSKQKDQLVLGDSLCHSVPRLGVGLGPLLLTSAPGGPRSWGASQVERGVLLCPVNRGARAGPQSPSFPEAPLRWDGAEAGSWGDDGLSGLPHP